MQDRQAYGSFTEGGQAYASVISLSREGRLVPLKGHNLPTVGDYVVGIVAEEKFSGYVVDLHSPYEGTFSTREVREEFKVGDVISAEIAEVNEVHKAILVAPRKFHAGRIIEVDFVKVPRIIGKNGSMLQLIRDYTNSELFIGKNGRVYIRSGNMALAELAVLKINEEAHYSGLTDRMNAFLEKERALIGKG